MCVMYMYLDECNIQCNTTCSKVTMVWYGVTFNLIYLCELPDNCTRYSIGVGYKLLLLLLEPEQGSDNRFYITWLHHSNHFFL